MYIRIIVILVLRLWVHDGVCISPCIKRAIAISDIWRVWHNRVLRNWYLLICYVYTLIITSLALHMTNVNLALQKTTVPRWRDALVMAETRHHQHMQYHLSISVHLIRVLQVTASNSSWYPCLNMFYNPEKVTLEWIEDDHSPSPPREGLSRQTKVTSRNDHSRITLSRPWAAVRH